MNTLWDWLAVILGILSLSMILGVLLMFFAPRDGD